MRGKVLLEKSATCALVCSKVIYANPTMAWAWQGWKELCTLSSKRILTGLTLVRAKKNCSLAWWQLQKHIISEVSCAQMRLLSPPALVDDNPVGYAPDRQMLPAAWLQHDVNRSKGLKQMTVIQLHDIAIHKHNKYAPYSFWLFPGSDKTSELHK